MYQMLRIPPVCRHLNQRVLVVFSCWPATHYWFDLIWFNCCTSLFRSIFIWGIYEQMRLCFPFKSVIGLKVPQRAGINSFQRGGTLFYFVTLCIFLLRVCSISCKSDTSGYEFVFISILLIRDSISINAFQSSIYVTFSQHIPFRSGSPTRWVDARVCTYENT